MGFRIKLEYKNYLGNQGKILELIWWTIVKKVIWEWRTHCRNNGISGRLKFHRNSITNLKLFFVFIFCLFQTSDFSKKHRTSNSICVFFWIPCWTPARSIRRCILSVLFQLNEFLFDLKKYIIKLKKILIINQ